jgi:hypothetical protein
MCRLIDIVDLMKPISLHVMSHSSHNIVHHPSTPTPNPQSPNPPIPNPQTPNTQSKNPPPIIKPHTPQNKKSSPPQILNILHKPHLKNAIRRHLQLRNLRPRIFADPEEDV